MEEMNKRQMNLQGQSLGLKEVYLFEKRFKELTTKFNGVKSQGNPLDFFILDVAEDRNHSDQLFISGRLSLNSTESISAIVKIAEV